MARPSSNKGRNTLLPEGLREVLFEFRPVGKILRVTAIDPKTGTEVIMVADPRYGDDAIKRLAARKLAYVISKKKVSQSGENGGDMLI